MIEKQLIKPVQNGGAPIYVSDLLKEQSNAKEGYSAILSELVNKSGTTEYKSPLGVLLGSFKNGVWVIEPTITPVNPSTWAISSGSFFVNGELLTFAGGNYDLSAPSGAYKTLIIGVNPTTATESRVFKDGFSKAINQTFNSSVILASKTAYGSLLIPAEVDQSKQYVIINNDEGVFPTVKDALGINNLTAIVENLESNTGASSNWSSLTLNVATGSIEYKKDFSGNVFLRGSSTLFLGAAGDITIATLPTGFRPTANTKLYAADYNGAPLAITIQPNGSIVVPRGVSYNSNVEMGGIAFPNS